MHPRHGKNFLNEIIPICVIAVFVLIFLYEMVFSSKIPLFRDLGPFFYPMRFSLAQSFQAGGLPLWDRHMAMGFPLLANFQSGTFYPPNLVYLILPFFTAVKVAFLLHSFVAALGAYFLIRHWGLLQPIALIGSILFTFGGYTISLVNLLNHFQSAVWLPWLLFLGEKQIISRDRSWVLILSLVATLQFLAGSPEIYGMSMALFFMNSLRVKWEGQTSYRRVFSSLAIVNLLVAGLAMVQILPTWELLREAARYRAPSLQWVTEWSLHPASLVNLIFLDKEVDVTSFARFQSFFSRPTPFLMSLYMGAIFPFGLWGWILTENKKRKTVLLTGITLSLLLSMGSYTPLYELFYNYVPLVSLSRFPEKFFFITFAFLLYITLQGLAVLLLHNYGPKFTKVLLGPAVLWGILVGFYLSFRIFPALLLTEEIFSGVLLHLERQIALLAAIAALFFLWQKGKVQKSIVQVLIVVIAFFDLYSAHRSYLFLADQNILRQRPKVSETLTDFSFYRVFFISPQSPLHPLIVLFPNAESPAAHSVLSFQALRPNTGIFWGIDYIQDIDALWKESYDHFRQVAKNLSTDKLYKLLGILNVKYLISLQELPQGAITQIGYFPEYPLWIYRIERVIPRAYIVPKAIYEKEPRKIIERLAEAGFDPSREVMLDESIQLLGSKNFVGEVKILSYANARISLDASLNESGLLVLADSFYPGWKVYVDAVEEKIMRANYFFRGVLLSPGSHRVTFRYEPASFRYGVIITIATLLLLLIFFVTHRMVRKIGYVNG